MRAQIKHQVITLVLLVNWVSSVCQPFQPPNPKKIPNTLHIHGDTLTDNYFWMRDKESADVINHLYAENAYASEILKPLEQQKKILIDEKLNFLNPENKSRRIRKNNFEFWSEFQKGKEFPVIYRVNLSEQGIIQTLFDPNLWAKKFGFFSMGGVITNPNQNYLFAGIDTTGSNIYDFHLIKIGEQENSLEIIPNSKSLVWLDNTHILYTKIDPISFRQNAVFKHEIGKPISSDILIYTEPDSTFEIELSKSSSEEFAFISSNKNTCSEIRYLACNDNSNLAQLFMKRQENLLYYIDHFYGKEFFIWSDYQAPDGRIDKCEIGKTAIKNWVPVVAPGSQLQIMNFFDTRNFFAYAINQNGDKKIICLAKKQKIADTILSPVPNGMISLSIDNFNYDSTTHLIIHCENLVTPAVTYNYQMSTGILSKIHTDSTVKFYATENYVTEKIYATAEDGSKIPIILAYKKGIKKNGKNPLLLEGYGAYGISNEPYFNPYNLSLLNRGVIFAIAQVRGGGELGKSWYDSGRMLNKKNTFSDFISSAETLISTGYTQKGKIIARGASAGGLLMGVIANERPDLFGAIVAEVPFVDVINTMLDETLPLTTFEFSEWGNPKKRKEYAYIKTYSPYENIRKQNYPPLYVRAGYNDAQVGYWEPAKWVAKLRDLKTDTNAIILVTDMESGHAGKSARIETIKEQAEIESFILHHFGMNEKQLFIEGIVRDENGSEIPFVNVYLKGTSIGTTSNADGRFSLLLREDNPKELVFQSLGFIKKTIKLNDSINWKAIDVKLKSESIQLNTVTVKANAKDPAYAIMTEASKRRKENQDLVRNFSASIYMKTTVKLVDLPKNLPFFISKKQFPDTNDLGLIYLSESVAKYTFQRPDKRKEEMIASRVAGSKTGYSWNRVEDVFVDFYEPGIKLFFYSERPFISPLAPLATLSYKFKFLGTFYQDDKPIHKIQVIPRRKGDPLFHGEIYIAEGDNYQIYSNDFFVTKDAQIDWADTVRIKQEMVKVNDLAWMPLQLKVYSHIRVFGFRATDLNTASISNYKINQQLPKRFFNSEVFRVEEEAIKKDTVYWTNTRPSVLSEEEEKHYQKSDSLLKKQESEPYKDSVLKAQNKMDIVEVLFNGYTYRNRFKNYRISFDPLLQSVSYNTIEGTRIKYAVDFFKRNRETRKSFFASGMIRYGTENYRWSGNGRLYVGYDPKHSQFIDISGGRYMNQYNNHDPISEFSNLLYTLFNKENWMKLYQDDRLKLSTGRELFNGFFANAGIQLSSRSSLTNKSLYYWVERPWHFTGNNPYDQKGEYNPLPDFNPHSLIQFNAGFRFIPFSQYELFPNYKRLIGSRWPEFFGNYRMGKSISGAQFAYHYLEAGLGKDIELRALGLLKLDICAGKFFENNGMNFIDYKHFSGNQTIFLSNKPSTDAPGAKTRDAISEFHALPYYAFSTNSQFVEFHLSHNFRSFFIGKLPLIRKTKFYEIIGINGVILDKRQYIEAYAGLDKIFQIFRLDIGSSIESGKGLKPFIRFGLRIGLAD